MSEVLIESAQGDLEILSVGSLLVSTNPRLSVHFDPRVNDHVLTIRQVKTSKQIFANEIYMPDGQMQRIHYFCLDLSV